MALRDQFNPKLPLVAARSFTFAGVKFEKGDPFPTGGFNPRLIRRQYEAGAVNHAKDDIASDSGAPAAPAADDNPVKMVPGPSNGRWTITAPWLAEPEVVRGKKNADNRFAELTEIGRPLGWIEGGSDVTVEQLEPTVFAVDAPWLEEFESHPTREAAEARQLELHQAGAPEGWHSWTPLIEVEQGAVTTEAEGKWVVSAPWLEAPEVIEDRDAAHARADEINEAGPPEGWEPPAE